MRIVSDFPQQLAGGLLAFDAEDEDGPFQLWVPLLLWEQLCAESPWAYDPEDRRDFGLSMIEAKAEGLAPATAPSGLRVLML